MTRRARRDLRFDVARERLRCSAGLEPNEAGIARYFQRILASDYRQEILDSLAYEGARCLLQAGADGAKARTADLQRVAAARGAH